MSSILFTDADGTWRLHNNKAFPASRFGGWTQSAIPIGDTAVRLSDGATTQFRQRTDYGVSIALAHIPSRRGWNSFVRAEAFDNASWTKSGATISADAAVGPDGSTTADKLVEDSANSAHFMSQPLTSATNNMDQAVSWFVKAAGRSWVALQITLKDANDVRAWFNVSTGAWGTVGAGINSRAANFWGNGWWRLEIGENISAGGTTPLGILRMATADNESSYQGDGASGVYVWGAQWEPDDKTNVPTPYLYTAASVVSAVSLVDVADRLVFHLLNGGTCSVYTNDVAASSYATCGLRPGTMPTVQLTDRRTMEYTFSAELINLAASPARMSAYYAEQ